jgi:hypothetical protein
MTSDRCAKPHQFKNNWWTTRASQKFVEIVLHTNALPSRRMNVASFILLPR